ncbi:MAG: MCE family protein [Chthonomonas sp.]|nr:MCE family protein [Chthonomonas sp.]
MQGAVKVGMLVVGFIAALLAAYAVLGRSIFAEKIDLYSATFKDASGMVAGSDVTLSGVRVGRIASIELESPGRAIMTLEVKKGTKIPVGTKAVIAGSLIGIGDRPLDLRPPATIGEMAPPGAQLEGVTQGALGALGPEGEETIKALNQTLIATKNLIEDEKLRSRVDTLLVSSNKTITQFGALASQINQMVGANQAQVQLAMKKAVAMMSDLQVATKSIARIAGDGKLEAQMNGLIAEMNATMRESNLLIADLRKTVNDPELRDPMKDILANTKAMSDSGTKIAADAELMAKNGVTVSEQAITVMDKASKLADELSEVLKKFNETLGGVAGLASGGKGVGKIDTEFGLTYESEPRELRTDFEASTVLGGSRLYLGLYDAFETNGLIAQIGRPISARSDLRYGVYAGKPGLGVSYRLAPGAILRGDLFDINNPRFNARARIDFNKEISGWFGVENIFDDPYPTIGFSIRR